MKRMIIMAALLLAAITTTNAQARIEKRSVGAGEIDYITKELTCEELTQISCFLPVELRLVDGAEGHIEISYPMDEHRYIRYGINDGTKLSIGRDGFQKAPKKTILSADTPIYLTVSSSKLCYILSTSDTEVFVESDRFADELMLTNSGYSLSIIAKSITAKESIKIHTTGTMTCEVEKWNSDNLQLFNNGYLYIDGTTTAKHIKHTSLGIDSTRLTVDCESLKVFARGEGIISYKGTAGNITINSLGKTTIRTSELIQK